MLAALTLPMLVLGARIFYDYYVFGHLLSPEKKIRALEQGVVTLTDNLLYYPRTLKDFHLGPPVIYVWVFLLAAAALLVGLGRRQYPTAQAKPERLAPSPASLGLIGIWIVSPLAILTMNLSKSPVVASIVVAPAVLWGALLIHRVLAALPSSAAFRGAGTALGAVSVVTGMTFMANYESRPSEQSAHAAQIQGLMKAYDDIAVYCRYYGLEKPNFATDRILEYFNGTAAAVMVFERSGLRILPRELLAYTIFARQADEAIGTAADADIALVTLDPVEKTKESLFPFHHSAVQWQTGYRDAVFSRMAPIARLNMPGHSFQIFLRPRATLEGETDGWLTAEGVVIAAPARALRVLPVIRLSGSTIGSKYLKGALGTIATLASERDGPATSTIPSKSAIHADESYEIEIDTAGIKLPDSGTVRLHLSFERYFIPRDLGINADPRKLVVQTPKSTTLSRQAGAAAATAPPLTVGDLYP